MSLIDEIVLLLQQHQEEVKKLLNKHNREIVEKLIEIEERRNDVYIS